MGKFHSLCLLLDFQFHGKVLVTQESKAFVVSECVHENSYGISLREWRAIEEEIIFAFLVNGEWNFPIQCCACLASLINLDLPD